MSNINKWVDTFERIMVAVTFAEAGDQKTALKIMRDRPATGIHRPERNVRKSVDRRPVLRA